jgi:hypothetical protein
MKNSIFARLTLVIAVMCSIIPGNVWAQSNAIDAALEGYIRDSQGAAVQGAKVAIRNEGTNIASEAQSNEEGYYRFPILPVGTYDVTATANGFKEYKQTGVSLAVGQKARLDVGMQIGALSESVEVKADVAIVDTGAAAVGSVLGEKDVEDLPIVSRNIYNYHLLSPGVIGLTSPTFGTTQLTFGGTERSSWSLDGLDNTQRGGNKQIRMVITTPEAVEEMQVLASGYSAEFGRAAGGQVNVILKSGTNALHGSALFLYRPYDLQARPSLAAVNPSDRTWYDAAGTFGGPIIKDRLFFFTQYEHNPYTLPNTISILPANAAALNLPTNELGTSPFGETYDTYTGKINYVLNDKNSGYVRYNRFTNHQPGAGSGLNIADRATDFHDHMNSGGVQLATVISPNLVNELRGGAIQRTQERYPTGPSNPAGAYITITNVAGFGYDPLAITLNTELSSEIVDNLTWTHGRSTWKAGVDIQHTNFDIRTPQNRNFTFGGLAAASGRPAVSALNQYLYTTQGLIDPSTGKPYTYTLFQEDGGNPLLNISFNFVNFFLQNEFRITPRLTLNFGARYEAILYPSLDQNAPYPLSRKITNDLKDIAPRVAFNWAPFQNMKTVVRGAFGMFYDVPGLSTFYTAAQTNGDQFLSYQIVGSNPLAPVFPNVPALNNVSLIVPPNINAFSPNLRTTYQLQGNLQIQRELLPNLSLTVGYNYAAEREGLFAQNINLGTPVSYLADGRPVFGGASSRLNPLFNQINLIQSGANTNYNGLFVNLQKRLSSGLQFAFTYTWSHALSDNIGEGGVGEDPTNLRRDYGNAGDDVRHNVVLQGLYEPRFTSDGLRWINGFEISTMTYYNSGYPINVITGTDLNNDGVLNDRPLFVGQNSVHGPAMLQIDARLARSFTFKERYRAQALIEAENLLNSTNANCSTTTGCTPAVVNTATAADFGRITSARTARNVQFGLKFNF